MTDSLQESEKKRRIKPIFIIVIAFLLIPIMTIIMLYFTSENLRYTMNDYLSLLPSNIGSYFKGMPTKEEKENLKQQIAKHYISLEEDRLVDKLLIVKGEDKDLYDELLLLLNRENPMKMRSVREHLRKAQLTPNLLQRILDDIDEEKTEKVNELARYYTSLKITDAIGEIERTYRSGELDREEIVSILENISVDQSARFLLYLDPALTEAIRYQLRETARRNIEKKIQETQNKEKELEALASIYEKKSLEEQVFDLGNDNKFRAQDLAVIFKNMKIETGGRILASVEEQAFATELYDQINTLEVLNKRETNLPVHLAEAVEIHKNYQTKVGELVEIYQRMSVEELTNVVEEMMRSNRIYSRHSVGDEEIVFTEEQLVVDVLNHLKPNKVAQLLEKLETERSIDLSQKFVVNAFR
ncbi:hypothetical protein [Clostridium formicaceticum]|uniref:MgtE intracellular N domain protein n=1 Tax=Clostridium formicaceticum TaxID=1497 RepID=A0AAC9RIT4_9CLOT|nr:hypothetical protein [Clostridium formicaceticum]AOY77317.1 hypothetical protein BJL90_16555 [Clostridium formicaceticum]ARE87861.1 MgtE intracellular N domain protein [Clostridium formicaceticum]